MSKDPAFLFYPNDYLGGTMGFSLEQHGAYLLLLIYQFNNGEFSIDKACSIVGVQIFESIRHKFQEKGGCLCNARLMQEIDKRKSFSDSRRENANKRWNKRLNNMQVHSMCNATALHMGNENENENENRIEDSIGINEKKEVKEKRKDWKNHYWTYLKTVILAYRDIIADEQYIQKLAKLHTRLDIRLSIRGACFAYWGRKEGWNNKKKASRGKISYSPDWRGTFARTIEINKIWADKNSPESEAAEKEARHRRLREKGIIK